MSASGEVGPHRALVERAARWLYGTGRCSVVYVEPVAFKVLEIPDAIGFKPSGESTVVECKASRSDFLGDRRKKCRQHARATGAGLGCERWYLAPPGVIKKSDDTLGWGVLEVRGSRCFRLRKPSRFKGRDDSALLTALLRRGDEPWPMQRSSGVVLPTSGPVPLFFRLPPELLTALKLQVAELSVSTQGYVEGLIRRSLPDRIIRQAQAATERNGESA